MLNNTKTQSRPKLLFLVPAISQTHESLENSQDFFFQDQDQDQDQDHGPRLWVSRPITQTKTLFFVLEAPRDQDFGLEDYITAKLAMYIVRMESWVFLPCYRTSHLSGWNSINRLASHSHNDRAS